MEEKAAGRQAVEGFVGDWLPFQPWRSAFTSIEASAPNSRPAEQAARARTIACSAESRSAAIQRFPGGNVPDALERRLEFAHKARPV